MTANVPQKLGRYEILEELGRGAMGVVFRARDPLIGREVAIKTFRLGYSVKDEEMEQFRRRFIREAQSAGILSHPNIVTVHDVVEESDHGMSFIAMEYVPGVTLKHYLQSDQPPDHEFAVDIVSQIASALDYAHAKGVIHRDIKPANILITQDQRAKIADFGIARLNTSSLTQDGQLLGTPNYMAPEQIMGREIDHRADLFALGVLLYELLTRQKPFSGENLTAVTHRVVYEAFTPPEQFVPGLPSGFTPILNKALEKDPAKRYQKAGDLVADLRAALTRARLDESAETVSVSKFTRPAPPPAAAVPASAAPPPPAGPPPAKGAGAGAAAEPGPKGGPAVSDKAKDKAGAAAKPAASAGPAAAAPAGAPAKAGAAPAKGAAAAKAAGPPGPEAMRTVNMPSGAAKTGKKSSVGLYAGLGLLAVAIAVGGYFATRGGGKAEPAAATPAVAPNQSPEYLASIADGQQKLLAGDPVGAAAAFSQAERVAPGDETASSLRQEAERQAAQKDATAQAAAKPPTPVRPTAPAGATATTALPEPLPGTAKPPAPATASAFAQLLVDFSTELPQGVLTVYVGRDQLMREGFRFSRRQENRTLEKTLTVPAGDSSLRVILALEGKPTRVVELKGNFRGGTSRTLVIRVDAAGQATANLK